MPVGFSRRPALSDRLVFAYEAFWELSTDRHVGMGLGPIPNRSIRSYAREHSVTGERFDLFLSCIRVLDGEYLRRLNPAPTK